MSYEALTIHITIVDHDPCILTIHASMVESALVMETAIGAPVHCTTLDTTVKVLMQILSLQLYYSECKREED